jgi:hypothetical protein
MKFFTPKRLFILGVICLVLGVVLPLLMVLKIAESTYFLNFLSYTLSLLGMILGTIGLAYYVSENRRKNK